MDTLAQFKICLGDVNLTMTVYAVTSVTQNQISIQIKLKGHNQYQKFFHVKFTFQTLEGLMVTLRHADLTSNEPLCRNVSWCLFRVKSKVDGHKNLKWMVCKSGRS